MLAEGPARIARGTTDPHPAQVGEVISEGDTIITGGNSQLHLNMEDTGFIAVRPNTRFRVVRYKAEGGAQDNALFQLLRGGFRSVSGWIGKYNSQGYVVRTPSATIGVRGTDHEPYYLPPGSAEGDPGTYDKVNSGETFIQTTAGQTAINPAQAGYVSERPNDKPAVLASIPRFYRPGPHEAEIEQKHLEIQRQIDQRREERRKVITDKQAETNAASARVRELSEQNRREAEQANREFAEKFRSMRERREAVQRDIATTREQSEALQAQRHQFEADFKTGGISVQEAQQRRPAMQAEAARVKQAFDEVDLRRKALQKENDETVDAQFKASQRRQEGLRQQVLEFRDKRETTESERDALKQEVRPLQEQENRRYQDELKADHKRDK